MTASLFILAQSVIGNLSSSTSDAASAPAHAGSFAFPTAWPQQTDLLTWCHTMSPGVAALLIIFGIVYLLFGFQIFKVLVLLNAAAVGAYFGAAIGGQGEPAMIGAVIGAIIAAAIAWPVMKYAVALMGGVFGVVLGASLWRTVGLDPHLAWAGALTGFIALGMLSFVLFKGSVMMYMSLQGSCMLVFGLLGLLFKYHSAAAQISQHLKIEPFILPAVVLIPAILGLVFQHHQETGGAAGGHGNGKK